MANNGMWMNVEGLATLQSQLKQLPEKIKKNELYRILRNVTGIVEDAARAEVAKIERDAESKGRQTTGNLYDSIGQIKGKSQDYLNMQVGPRVSGRAASYWKSRKYSGGRMKSSRGNYKGFHAHLVHFGTAGRATKKGKDRGAATANPFMERAFKKTLSQVKPKFEMEIAKSTEKLFKKHVFPTV